MNDQSREPIVGMTKAQVLRDLFLSRLQWCGCGSPDKAYRWFRAHLRACGHERGRGCLHYLGGDGALGCMRYQFEALGLTEHGSSVYGAWRTSTGDLMLDAMMTTTWREVDEAPWPDEQERSSDPPVKAQPTPEQQMRYMALRYWGAG